MPIKRRWIVEGSLGCMTLHRRLARDYETRSDQAESMIRIATLDNATKRVTGETTPTWRDSVNDNQLQTM